VLKEFKMKKVSVILTTYNSESSISRAIDSILNQKGIDKSFQLELIVVDDCSLDKTQQILNNYNIKFLTTGINSGGPNKGRNLGLKAANGDYICLADHDDEWVPDKIISQLPYLEKVPIVSSGYTLVNSITGKKTERVSFCAQPYIFFEKNLTFITTLKKSGKGQKTYLGSLIYRSSLKNILFEEVHGVLDYDWLLKLFENNDSVEVCKSLYFRNIDGSNLSLNEDYRLRDFNYSLAFINKYKETYPREYSISYKRIHGSLARYYYVVNKMKLARSCFLRSGLSFKTLAYILTSYCCAEFVKRKFNVFG
jgi:glycosyltransferase involved in cell wall biosynthesis